MSQHFTKIYEDSIKNPEKFWKEISNDIFWFKKPTKILNKSNPPFYRWFEDGITNKTSLMKSKLSLINIDIT